MESRILVLAAISGFAVGVVPGTGTSLTGATGPGVRTAVQESYAVTPDGVRLYYRIVGDGAQTVIVPLASLHGDRLDALAGPDRRLVLFDPRNRGRSEAAALSDVSLDHQISDVEAVRMAVGAERVDLIGWSGLGMELWAYTLRHPERVRRFVQLAPVPPRQEPWIQEMAADRGQRLDSVAVRNFRRRVEAGEFEADPAARCRLSNRIEWAASLADPDLVSETPDICDSENEWGANLGPYFNALLGSFGTYDWRPTLDSVTVPRLVIHGARDNIPLAGNAEWVAGGRNARILVVDGAGHWPHYEAPDTVIAAIDTFLDGSWPPGSIADVSRLPDTGPVSAIRDPGPLSLNAYHRGRAILASARDALARAGVGSGETSEALALWMSAASLQRQQSPSAEPPYDTLPTTERLAFDPVAGRVAYEFRARWPDFIRHVARVAGPTGGILRDFNQDEERWSEDLTADRLAFLRRRIPQLVLRDAFSAAESIRYLGRGSVGDRPADVVSYREPGGATAAIYVDAETAVPLAHETLTDDFRYGDSADRITYRDYRVESGVYVPGRLELSVGTDSSGTVVLDSLSTRPEAVARAMAPLDSVAASDGAGRGARGESGEIDAPSSADGAASFEELAAGVHLAAVAGAPGYHVLFVDLGQGLLAVEAPGSDAVTRMAIDGAERRFGKRVTHAAVTHHHSDHSAGVAAYLRHGATLLTTAGNVRFFRDVATAPRSLSGGEAVAEPLPIEVVEGERRLAGRTDVILRDVGPHSHADEHLVVLVPSAGLVFQGDLVRFPPDGDLEPARAQTRSLMALIDELDWPVRMIAGVHGRVGTVEELRRAIELAGGDGG